VARISGPGEGYLLSSPLFHSDVDVEFRFIRKKIYPDILRFDLFENSHLIQSHQRVVQKRGIENFTFSEKDFMLDDLIAGRVAREYNAVDELLTAFIEADGQADHFPIFIEIETSDGCDVAKG
jgi:hypothetical protein